MRRIVLQPAYVLHRRLYRETSFLVEIFTKEYGRLTVIAKGARKAKSSMQGLLQPFIPLYISFVGNGELMTLSQVEMNGVARFLRGECLFTGFYLNELLMRLTQKWDAQPGIYLAYERTLMMLQPGNVEQKTLRTFEKYLLEELGYGLLPKTDALLSAAFLPDCYYQFYFEKGFVLSDVKQFSSMPMNLFLGKHLLAMAKDDWQGEEVLRDAKRLMRLVFTTLLGERPLYSRKLFTHDDRWGLE